VGQGGSRDRDETRKAPEDASRTLRREVQFICVFDPKCHEMKKKFLGSIPLTYLAAVSVSYKNF